MNFEDRFDIKVEAQRAKELYPIYMFDIYCARVINQGKEEYARQKLENKFFAFHDYEQSSLVRGKK